VSESLRWLSAFQLHLTRWWVLNYSEVSNNWVYTNWH